MGSHRVRHDWSDLAAAASLFQLFKEIIPEILIFWVYNFLLVGTFCVLCVCLPQPLPTRCQQSFLPNFTTVLTSKHVSWDCQCSVEKKTMTMLENYCFKDSLGVRYTQRIILFHLLEKRNESVSLVVQSCLTLCNYMDCSPPGTSVHGILQAKILQWVPISYSRGSSRTRDWTQVSYIAGRFVTVWATREVYLLR